MKPVLRSASRRSAALAQLLLFVFSLSTSLLPCSDARAGGTGVSHHVSPDRSGDRSPPMPHDMSAHQRMSEAPIDVAASHDLAPAETPTPNERPAPAGEMSCPLMIACSGIVQFADDLEWRSVVSSTPTDAPTGLVLARASADLDVDSPPPRR